MKSMKSLNTVLFLVCMGVAVASGQVSAPARSKVTRQRKDARQQHIVEARNARKSLHGWSQASARPMATPPLVNLPSPTTNVGFQTALHISAGTTPSTGMAVVPYISALGHFNKDSKQDLAAIVQDPH